MANVNWPAAYVAFVKGSPESEICEVFGIKPTVLKERMRREQWVALRQQLPLITNTTAPTPLPALQGGTPFDKGVVTTVPVNSMAPGLRAQFETLAANRAANLGQARRLRQHVDRVLTLLENDKLELDQIFCHKGVVTKVKRKPSMQDLVALATYMKMTQDMTYRALGDISATEKGSQDMRPGDANSGIQPITIILPGAIAEPRDKRVLKEKLEGAGHRVVDVPHLADVSQPVQPGAPVIDIDAQSVGCPICGADTTEPHDDTCPNKPKKHAGANPIDVMKGFV